MNRGTEMPKRMSIREKRKLRNVIFAGTLFFIVWFLFSPWGLIRYYRVNTDLEKARETNLQLKEKNRLLEEEIDKLSNSPEYIEKVAREKYGLIKKNEIIFDFSKRK